MATVVEILASVLTSGVGVALVVIFTIRRRLHRTNRLVAGRRSVAPASWIWSPRRAAVLHRRLRGCCEVAVQAAATVGAPAPVSTRRRLVGRRRQGAPGPFERLAAELIARAVDLDAQLVAADRRTGQWRRQLLGELTSAVRELESFSSRMDALARTWAQELSGPLAPSTDLGDRLEALEATLSELRVSPPVTQPATRSRRG